MIQKKRWVSEVINIDIKATRLRTFNGRVVIIPSAVEGECCARIAFPLSTLEDGRGKSVPIDHLEGFGVRGTGR